MPRTHSEAHPLLKNNIRDALVKRAPAPGWTQWLEDIAEDIQVHPNTMLRAWRAEGLISAATIWCLCQHEKLEGFEAEIYGKTCTPCRPGSASDLSEHIATLRATADSIEATQTPVVPITRRRA